MTAEAQRIAIAESLGIVSIRHERPAIGVPEFWYGIRKSDSTRVGIPDFLNDLNAMNEPEKTLARDQWQTYFDLLMETIAGSSSNPIHAYYPTVVHATAAQRCEAFLKTTGRWKEA